MIGFVDDRTESECEHCLPILNLATTSFFLDFDGVLCDLADTPDSIEVDPKLPALLTKLSDRVEGRLVVVSGRGIDDLAARLPGFRGTLIAGHGAEERIAGRMHRHKIAGAEMVERLGDMVEAFCATHAGMLCERKPTGVVLHFRKAEREAGRAYDFMRALDNSHEGFSLHHAKMAYELRPTGVSKEAAIRRVMDREGFYGTKPVFFGDDATDEPALSWVGARGGIAVKVGEGDTVARYRVPDPAFVRSFLSEQLGR
ncbi:trehalose-phosphatase [Mesobaculum littorinae]|uniref:Trehalose 6-phosphate phosphatase n=2 Tax=Mesobaculum littorinae TaxID=2486419 RepID=A0A438AGB9_9RHOB|nr:trehalose-phosphatase [Mesobaculum littorinae]